MVVVVRGCSESNFAGILVLFVLNLARFSDFESTWFADLADWNCLARKWKVVASRKWAGLSGHWVEVSWQAGLINESNHLLGWFPWVCSD